MKKLRDALESAKNQDFKKMFPPRLCQGDSESFREMVGGDVRPDVRLTADAVKYLSKAGAINVVPQSPPSVMMLHPGHMHLVLNHCTQIKFACELMRPDQVCHAASYHRQLGSVIFGEINAEDYTSMYVQLEDTVKAIVSGQGCPV